MGAAIRKTGALFAKDVKDLVKNPSSLLMCLLPIFFVVMYTFLTADQAKADPETQAFVASFLLQISFPMAAGAICSMAATSALAEEKEKSTLRTLMLANVGAGQILTSRAVTTLIGIGLTDAVCYLISGNPIESMAICVAIGIVGSVPLVLISLLLGLAARDQMTAGIYSVPVLGIALAPIFGIYNDGVANVVGILPTGGMNNLVKLAIEGNLFSGEAASPLLITLAWIVAAAIAFVLLFKRLARDN